MKVRILVQLALSIALLVIGGVIASFVRDNADIGRGHGAVAITGAINGNDAGGVIGGRAYQATDYPRIVWIVVAALLALIWIAPLLWAHRPRRMPKSAAFALFAIPLLLAACGRDGLQTKTRQVAVGASETAFVINASLPKDQAQLTSESFLKQNQVPSGQIPIRYSQFKLNSDNRLGRSDSWGWKPDNYVYILDRAPVTREWTSTSGSGTNAANQSFSLQSAEAIKFSLGMNCTGQVAEADAAKFIAVYSGTGRKVVGDDNFKAMPDAVWMVGAISAVMDNNVRGAFQGRLLGDFAGKSLDEDNKQIGAIMAAAVTDITKEFSANGLTLLNCGAHGGFTFDNPDVQTAANAKFVAEQQSSAKIITAQNEAQAQTVTNQKNVEQAKADATVAKTKQDQELAYDKALADALRNNPEVSQYIAANRWNGTPPQYVGNNAPPPYINVGAQK